MEFVQRAGGGGSVALLPGAWNPPTLAHVAMARAARRWASESVLVVPRAFPHKTFDGPGLEVRLEWLRRLAGDEFSVAVAEQGLFIDMAREWRRAAGPGRVFVVCGTDAAERIVNWEYGPGDSIERQLEEYELLVAARGSAYVPPEPLSARIHTLALGDDWHDVSSTDVRERIRRGEDWAGLVPAAIADTVARAYS
jgi:nicotinic acid mononucleotide adenylyltransferase